MSSRPQPLLYECKLIRLITVLCRELAVLVVFSDVTHASGIYSVIHCFNIRHQLKLKIYHFNVHTLTLYEPQAIQ